jgi:hypothetical protein
MENLTNISSSSIANTVEMKFLLISPNIPLIIIFTFGIRQIYLGIEISHPIYMALFCNLVSHLISSILEIMIAPFLTKIRITTLIKGSFTFCILFHCCCWCVLSVLRYIYIIHGDWLSNKIPENKTITIITISAIYTLFLVGSTVVFLPTIYFGWPYKEVYELETGPKLICLLSILSTYVVLLGFSCFFYFLMLRHRGALCQNAVAASHDENENQDHHEKGQNQSYTKVSEKCLNNFRIQNLHLVHVAKT